MLCDVVKLITLFGKLRLQSATLHDSKCQPISHTLPTATAKEGANNIPHLHSHHNVISDILDGFNVNEITTLCFIDLQKCFDTIDHSILLKKLNMYGFTGTTLNWFKNYLTGRKQCVNTNGFISTLIFVWEFPKDLYWDQFSF